MAGKKKPAQVVVKAIEKAKNPAPKRGPDPVRAREERDGRIDHIITMMSRGEWEGQRSHAKLAASWDLSTHTVADLAREASGIIRRIVDGDKAEVLAEILAGVRLTRRLALARHKVAVSKDGEVHEYEDPDCHAALKADELVMKGLGLIVQKTQEVPPAHLTDEQLLKELDEAREVVRARMKK